MGRLCGSHEAPRSQRSLRLRAEPESIMERCRLSANGQRPRRLHQMGRGAGLCALAGRPYRTSLSAFDGGRVGIFRARGLDDRISVGRGARSRARELWARRMLRTPDARSRSLGKYFSRRLVSTQCFRPLRHARQRLRVGSGLPLGLLCRLTDEWFGLREEGLRIPRGEGRGLCRYMEGHALCRPELCAA